MRPFDQQPMPLFDQTRYVGPTAPRACESGNGGKLPPPYEGDVLLAEPPQKRGDKH